MPTGGSLHIETLDVEGNGLIGAVGAPYVLLRVTDTGVGMPPELVERAFEPFFTTKAPGQGSGLGLATVHGIVSQALGHVQIRSSVGRGTSVEVFLPATDRPVDQATSSPSIEPTPGHRATILVVEDESAIRELARRLLSRKGYTVLVAADGHEATAIAERHPGPIDLLLTDVVMPKMLGDEVARRVTAVRADTQVLFMSGYAVPVFSSLGTFDEDVALLEKPFTEAELLTAVSARLSVQG
jgi:CheY-like chemotaxis protein